MGNGRISAPDLRRRVHHQFVFPELRIPSVDHLPAPREVGIGSHRTGDVPQFPDRQRVEAGKQLPVLVRLLEMKVAGQRVLGLFRLARAPAPGPRRIHRGRHGKPQIETVPGLRVRLVNPLPDVQRPAGKPETVILPLPEPDGHPADQKQIQRPGVLHDPEQEGLVARPGFGETFDIAHPVFEQQGPLTQRAGNNGFLE